MYLFVGTSVHNACVSCISINPAKTRNLKSHSSIEILHGNNADGEWAFQLNMYLCSY